MHEPSAAAARTALVDLNEIGAGIAGGAAGGALAGVGARLSMRGVALAAGLRPSFSVDGTLFIIIFGFILGLVFGALFGFVRRWLPGRAFVQGLVFGLALLAFLVAPAFLLAEPEGELAFLPPLVSLALFAPLPLLYGIATAGVAGRMAGRASSAARPVGALWVLAFFAALLMALSGLAGLAAVFRSPPALSTAIREMGLRFAQWRSLNMGFLFVFALSYCGLSSLIFWRGVHSRPARLAALALLLFGGVFFRPRPPLGGVMLALFGGAARLEILLWLIVAGLLAAGLAVFARRYRRFTPVQRRSARPAVIGVAAAVLGFAVVWLVAALAPGLWPAGAPAPRSLFLFPPYLLPWLLPPAATAYAMWRRGLWLASEARD